MCSDIQSFKEEEEDNIGEDLEEDVEVEEEERGGGKNLYYSNQNAVVFISSKNYVSFK